MIYPAGYEVFVFHRRWGSSVSPGMFTRLWPLIRWADVVHLTAVYSAPTIPTLLACRLLGKPVVWSPRGALQRWEEATKPLAKKAWERICNALVSRTKCVLHVTSEQEAHESFKRIPKAAVTVIPNGVEIPETLPERDWMPGGRLRLLYIGRLHRKKGLENLLRALKILGDETVLLTVCGSGDAAYTQSLRELSRELHLEQRVTFYGHVDGGSKRDAFLHADVCVVPSFTENFGMVAAEALAHGVPVIASRGTPWADLEKHGCGLWVDNTPAILARSIMEIRSENLYEMGKRGRVWMQQDLTWGSVAAEMFDLYQDLSER
jgi:glycosyltransferase involved in cell wall biosynthesis